MAGLCGVGADPPAVADLWHQAAPAGLETGDLVERQLAVFGFSNNRYFIAHGRRVLSKETAAHDSCFSRLSEAVDYARDVQGKGFGLCASKPLEFNLQVVRSTEQAEA